MNKQIGAKNKQEDASSGKDFEVGEIAGMEKNNRVPTVSLSSKDSKQAKDAQNVKASPPKSAEEKKKEEPKAEVKKESYKRPEGHVLLKVKKENKDLVDIIKKGNDNVRVEELDSHIEVSAEQLRVTRQDAERKLGAMNNGQWRMLFMNREGEVSSYTDTEFVLGIVESKIEERKELAQINTKILAESKAKMDDVRFLLGMTQTQFLEIAIEEFAEKVKKETL